MTDKYKAMIYNYNYKQDKCLYSPLHIYIEPTNYCNLTCPNCVRDKLTRPKGYIEKELYNNIIKQCVRLKIQWAYLFFFGESMLHKDINYLISKAQDNNIKVRLHTNGTVGDLSVIPTPDKLCVSLNSTNVNNKKLLRNLEKLKSSNCNFIIEDLDGFSETTQIKEKYGSYIDRRIPHNWHGDLGNKNQDKTLCSHPYKSIAILWDGRVVPCCVDYNAEYVVGDINVLKLEEIWNGPLMRAIRQHPKAICSGCNHRRLP